MKLWMILFYVVGLAFSPEGIADICKNAKEGANKSPNAKKRLCK